MSNATVSAPPQRRAGRVRVTLRSLHDEVQRLRERVEDLEDLREFERRHRTKQGQETHPVGAGEEGTWVG